VKAGMVFGKLVYEICMLCWRLAKVGLISCFITILRLNYINN
jgi:hypothetical protein